MDRAEDGFNMVVNYELRSAQRYRRFASLLMAGVVDGSGDMESLLRPIVRDSDELVRLNGTGVILMPETDGAGVQAAVRRFQEHLADSDVDLRFSIVTYPTDGKTEEDLFAAARRRFVISCGLGKGAVVASG